MVALVILYVYIRYVLKKIRLAKQTVKFKCTAIQEVNLLSTTLYAF